VRAVNAHAELLAAAQEIVDTYSIFTSPSYDTMKRLRAAIAQATGEL
jgi:hypothetical protein